MNIPFLVLGGVAVLTTARFFQMDKDVGWGVIATFLWFMMALVTVQDNPGNWIHSRIFGFFGLILTILTLVGVIQRLKPKDQYFDDWG